MFSEIQTIPDAAAEIKGSSEFPEIRGMVYPCAETGNDGN